MALVLYDRVQQTGTANTTVSFTLSGSVTGYQSFSVVGNGNTTFYGATDTSGNWEVGIGTYATGGTLTRTTILASSNSGSAVTFSGTVTVFVTYPSEKSVNLDASGNVSALGTISSGTWNGSTVGVAYGGTGVTASSGANSVVLRDANQNVSANNFLNGYDAVTATGGTTVLTAASAYYQRLSGSTTQTFQLPDATTCVLGQAWVFDNDSSGTLTVVDNASAVVDTIPSGGYGYIFAESISTSAGSWGKYALLPANYDFNTTTANFGNATITNATWNGTAIASGYGGTGLTTFTAANYALYSTSASALTAGTLPIAAGGTGLTTYTAGDLPYYSSGATFSKLPIGTNGQVLTSSGTAPQWTNASSIVGGAAGSNTQVQFNNSGALGASSGLTWNGSTLTASAMDNTPIGNTTPNTGTFTTLTAQTEVLKGTGQNLFRTTNNFSSWGTVGGTLTLSTATTDPFGGTNVYKLVANSGESPTVGNSDILTTSSTILAAGAYYTESIYIKAAEFSAISIRSNTSGSIYTFTIGSTPSGNTEFINPALTSVGNGWYRCSMTFTTTGAQTTANMQPKLATANATPLVTGDGYSGILIWGAQLEAGAFATSLIPTVASQVTRSADSASMTGVNFSSWYNQFAGTAYIEALVNRSIANFTSLVDFGNGTTTNRWTLCNNGGPANATDVVNNVAYGSVTSANAATQGVAFKTAAYHSASGSGVCLNGGTPVTTASDVLFTACTVATIGLRNDANLPMNGTIKRLSYFPVALTSAQLKAITA